MIRSHDFNSDWSGQRAGIVADDSFFELPSDQARAALDPWDWVEARGSLEPERCLRIGRAGFSLVDTQVRFRVGLAGLTATPSVERLEVASADEEPFAVRAEELAEFRHERFRVVPGRTDADVARRYALWSQHLLAESPATCLRVSLEGQPQGWFLSRPEGGGLELTLAMLTADATITGHHLYHRALLAYAQRGFRVGQASFSVTNTSVLNIYSSLGARFLAPSGCWLWTKGEG